MYRKKERKKERKEPFQLFSVHSRIESLNNFDQDDRKMDDLAWLSFKKETLFEDTSYFQIQPPIIGHSDLQKPLEVKPKNIPAYEPRLWSFWFSALKKEISSVLMNPDGWVIGQLMSPSHV